LSVARKHHFIAQSFLRGFSDTEGRLHVYDLETGKERRVNPKEVAHQRDFYAVNIPGVRPDILETEFSRVEGASVEVIRRIEMDKTLSTTDDFGQLLYFIALQAVRGPDHRRRMEEMTSDLRRQAEPIIRDMHRVHVAPQHGAPPVDEWVAERLDREAGPLTQDDHIRSMLNLHGDLLQALDQMRSVFTLLPPKSGFELACSDAPFTCIVPLEGGAFRWAGWRDPQATISMALSKRLFWQAGWWPKPDMFLDLGDETHQGMAKMAAWTTQLGNFYTTLNARFVYASRPGSPDRLPSWPPPTKPA
jgi:hypothetical protein